MKTTMKLMMLVLVISITSCQKQPRAAFTISPKTIMPGEKVTCTNTSIDGYSYVWTTPSGTTSKSKDITITAGSATGERTVKLEVFSKNGKKMSTYTDTYTVLENYNKAFAGSYLGTLTNDFYISNTAVTTNGSDKITLDGNLGFNLDFTITSSSAGTLVPKIVYAGTDTYHFKSGSIAKSGNTLTITMVVDYTDATNSANNYYNYSVSDVIVK